MYESPIELTTEEISLRLIEQQEKEIIEAVLRTGVNVDREELIKAWKYDRGQYDNGYRDGAKDTAGWLQREIRDALDSNYHARSERMKKLSIDSADEFVSYCDGKIAALRGLYDFICERFGDNNGPYRT